MEAKKDKIMLVDNSDNLRHVIKDYLEMNGYVVEDFNDGNDAMNSFNKDIFDLCIFDVRMKNCDGFKLLNKVRQLDKNVPIIILSSLSEKADRIKCFNLGCDDYITKPFSIEELELRIKAILRRCKQNAPGKYDTDNDEVYKFGSFVLNCSELQLIHPKRTRQLTKKECELLKLLAIHKNKLVPREIIMKEIWGEDTSSESRSLDVFLTRLRTYLTLGSEKYILPRDSQKRKIHYSKGYVPNVEIANIHGTGFMLKVRDDE